MLLNVKASGVGDYIVCLVEFTDRGATVSYHAEVVVSWIDSGWNLNAVLCSRGIVTGGYTAPTEFVDVDVARGYGAVCREVEFPVERAGVVVTIVLNSVGYRDGITHHHGTCGGADIVSNDVRQVIFNRNLGTACVSIV